MAKKYSMVYMVLGSVFTAIGIFFTIIGTIKQSKETNEFQEKIKSLTEEVKNNQELNKNITQRTFELTEGLKEESKENFKKLKLPELTVFDFKERTDLGLNSYIEVFVKNTGNGSCYNVELLIDEHNLPLAKPAQHSVSRIQKIPKDGIVFYKIPLFQTELMSRVADDDQKKELEEFFRRFSENKAVVNIKFHLQYNTEEEEQILSKPYVFFKHNSFGTDLRIQSFDK